MNRIVREHYPVEKLPADLREGMEPGETVRVTVEEVPHPDGSKERLAALLELARRAQPIGDDPVERIRRLRDEWDD